MTSWGVNLPSTFCFQLHPSPLKGRWITATYLDGFIRTWHSKRISLAPVSVLSDWYYGLLEWYPPGDWASLNWWGCSISCSSSQRLPSISWTRWRGSLRNITLLRKSVDACRSSMKPIILCSHLTSVEPVRCIGSLTMNCPKCASISDAKIRIFLW